MACSTPEPATPEPSEPRVFRLLGVEDAEVFLAEDGAQVRHDPATSQIDGVGVNHSWHLGKVLPACLVHPLALPPAGDPGGFRKLAWDGATGAWLIELSGDNRCGLEGRLVLELEGPQVDSSGLSVDGVPYKDGGMAKAQDHLRAWVRATARSSWADLTEAERRDVAHSLGHDPDPDADAVLAELLERFPDASQLRAASQERALRAP